MNFTVQIFKLEIYLSLNQDFDWGVKWFGTLLESFNQICTIYVWKHDLVNLHANLNPKCVTHGKAVRSAISLHINRCTVKVKLFSNTELFFNNIKNDIHVSFLLDTWQIKINFFLWFTEIFNQFRSFHLIKVMEQKFSFI